MPRFSIILIHYQPTIPHAILCRGLDSLKAQTYQDFELLAYHDGPLTDTSVQMPVPMICSDQRYDDWGHSLRDMGIRRATGDYIIHFNADNILYPNALEEISRAIDRPPRVFEQGTQRVLDTSAIIIFAILCRGLQRVNNFMIWFRDHPEYTLLLTGNPPRQNFIDAMQLVMRRDLWLAEGGWYDKSTAGDGPMYERFATKYGYRSVDQVLGEHF
ncbi:MAG: glycosyltransferase [Tepidisphaeraceae bacterium]|jgi:GT2 family glycosyltransferase